MERNIKKMEEEGEGREEKKISYLWEKGTW